VIRVNGRQNGLELIDRMGRSDDVLGTDRRPAAIGVADRECRRAERHDDSAEQNPRASLEADRGPKHDPSVLP
jgi:hypothetical protein